MAYLALDIVLMSKLNFLLFVVVVVVPSIGLYKINLF